MQLKVFRINASGETESITINDVYSYEIVGEGNEPYKLIAYGDVWLQVIHDVIGFIYN